MDIKELEPGFSICHAINPHDISDLMSLVLGIITLTESTTLAVHFRF